jgi:hypothetical protein
MILICLFSYPELLGSSWAQAGEFCCTITAIDQTTGIVTATETGTGKVFQFKKIIPGVSPTLRAVSPGALTFLESLKIGQTVSADFISRKVSIINNETCCIMIQPNPDIPHK